MKVEFPAVRECAATLADGSRVIVRGLNALQRDEARENAEHAALLRLARWAPGTAAAEALEGRFSGFDAAAQAHYAAGAAAIAEEWLLQAEERFPDSVEESEGPLDSRLAAAVKSAAEDRAAQREEWLRNKYDAAVEETGSRPDAERCRICAAAWRERQYHNLLTTRFAVEVIYHAVRSPEDFARRFFTSTEAVSDLADADMAALCSAYREADPVSPYQIPISRSAS